VPGARGRPCTPGPSARPEGPLCMPGSSEAPRALSGCPCLRASRCAAAPVASAVGEAPVGLHGSPPRVRPEVAHRGWRGPVERPVEERGLGLLALRPGGMRSPTATCAPCDSVLRRVAAAARCSDALVCLLCRVWPGFACRVDVRTKWPGACTVGSPQGLVSAQNEFGATFTLPSLGTRQHA